MRLAVVRIGFCAFAKHGMPQQYMHDGRQHQPGVAGQHGVFAATGLQVVGITAMTCWVCCWVSFFHSSTRSGTRSRSGISRRTSVITSGASKAACSRSTVHSATARVSAPAASCGPRRQLRHLRPVGAVQAAVQQRLEDGVLAVEMGIQPAFGQAAALGNVVHPRRREATARELLQRRVQYLRHALRGCQAQSAPGLSPIVVHHARYCHASKSSLGKTKYAIRYRLVGCYSGLSHAQLPDP